MIKSRKKLYLNVRAGIYGKVTSFRYASFLITSSTMIETIFSVFLTNLFSKIA